MSARLVPPAVVALIECSAIVAACEGKLVHMIGAGEMDLARIAEADGEIDRNAEIIKEKLTKLAWSAGREAEEARGP